MIDLETLGLRPNAVIVQVSAVAFELDSDLDGNIYHRYLIIQEQLDNGATIDENTLLWLVENNIKAFNKDNIKWSMYSTLRDLNKFIDLQAPKYIWAKSPQFDIVKLEWWLNKSNKKPKWTYDMLRDVRTLQWASDRDFTNINAKFSNKPHNSLTNCQYQIQIVKECLNNSPILKDLI